jgi:nitroreductase
MSASIKKLMQWRFACKHFETEKKLDQSVINDLIDTARLTPCSYGLQAWKFLVVTNQELLKKLQPVCFNQPQIVECSALVVLLARTDLNGDTGAIADYLLKYQKDLGRTSEELIPFKHNLEGMLEKLSPAEQLSWVQKQVYLAASTLMIAAAEKTIDSCPMEGFETAGVAKVLELPSSLVPTILVALGFRKMDKPIKSRFELKDVLDLRN